MHNDLWAGYKSAVFDTFPDLKFEKQHESWTNKRGVNLTADLYSGQYFIKSRHVNIWDDKLNIHNNVIYPKTDAKVPCGLLPCFGMDLMGFNENKVIIVFDFQHPIEKFLFSVDWLPKAKKSYRFFEMGNHFSENIFVRYCTFDEVDDYLPEFRQYLETYRDMIDDSKPVGIEIDSYKDFDTYMKRLDPILGYLTGNFGKENANRMMDEFFFPYAE